MTPKPLRPCTPARLLAGCVLVVVAAGCGVKGAPLPPLIRVADTTRDLVVVQQGHEAVLDWGYPSITTAGGPLPDVEAVEVWRTTLPAGLEPSATSHREREIRYQLLEAQGDVLVLLDAAGLQRATRGPRLEIKDDLVRWRGIHGTEQKWIIWYAVRTICCRGRRSAFSNIARLDPQIPPAPPVGLVVSPGIGGVDLTWQTESGLTAIVERATETGDWVTVTLDSVTDGEWRDETATQGENWRYRLRSESPLADGGRVVGEPGEVVTVSYPDVYPPSAPENLVCLPEAVRVRVRWQSSAGTSWYLVERRVGIGAWEVISRRHREVEFEDIDPPLGSITYSVRAIDKDGNQSERVTCDALIGAIPDGE